MGAFNLLVIIAVCIVVIPAGEFRRIESLPAFYITAFFSMGAYMWMAFILTVSSPQMVDVWEAAATFLLLPVLIYISYKVDKGDADCILRRLGLAEACDEDTDICDTDCFFCFIDDAMQIAGSTEEQTLEFKVLRRGNI